MKNYSKPDIEEMKKQVKQLKETVQKYDTQGDNFQSNIPKTTVKKPIPLRTLLSVSPTRDKADNDTNISRQSDKKEESTIDVNELEQISDYKFFTKQELISTINSYKVLVKNINKKAFKAMEEIENKYKSEVGILKKKYANKKTKVDKLLKELEQITILKNEKESLSKEVEAANYANYQLEQEINTYNDNIESLNKEIKGYKKIEKELKIVKKEKSELQKQLKDLSSSYNLQLEEKNVLKTNITKEKQTKETEKEEFLQIIKKLENDINSKNVTIDKSSDRCAALEKCIEHKKNDELETKEHIGFLEKSLKESKKETGELEVNLVKLQTENKYLNEKIIELEEKNKTKDKQINELQDKVEIILNDEKKQTAYVREKDELLEFKTNLIEHLQQKNRDMELYIEQLNNKEKDYLTQYQEFIKDYNDLEARYLRIKQEFNYLTEENEINKSQLLKLKQDNHKVCSIQEINAKPNKMKQLDEINSLISQYRRTKI